MNYHLGKCRVYKHCELQLEQTYCIHLSVTLETVYHTCNKSNKILKDEIRRTAYKLQEKNARKNDERMKKRKIPSQLLHKKDTSQTNKCQRKA